MTRMFPTMEELEGYLESVEEFVFSSFSATTSDLPNMREAANRLWRDFSRYGPSPFPGDYPVPPPPPPLPPKSWLESSMDWISEHPWKTSGIILGVIGASCVVGYSAVRTRKVRVIKIKPVSKERKQVVVVLGGDHPLAFPLIVELEKKGYIVIASVSSPEAVDNLESKCHGYVCALVLDPTDPSTIPVFLRSLTSTLSRRFPLNASGDPHVTLSSYPYTHAVICLLSLPSSTVHPPPAPLEHISLYGTYLPYLTATHITPLQVIQALMPLLRTTPARSRDIASGNYGKKTIIVCVPAADGRVGLPFGSVQAMSAAAMLRGVEVLRREINAAAVTDKSECMNNIKVVVVDVGVVSDGSCTEGSSMSPQSVYKAMEDWTASEKLTYGPAFASIAQAGGPSRPTSRWKTVKAVLEGKVPFGVRRRGWNVSVFVDRIVGIVNGRNGISSMIGLGLGVGRIRDWIRGEWVAVGAGANTYGMASHLPTVLLDTILNIPHMLVSIRNKLLPVPPPPPPPPPPAIQSLGAAKGDNDKENGKDGSEVGSEADVESNAGDGRSVDSSWVSLKEGSSAD